MTLHPFEVRLGNLLALSYPALVMAYKDKIALAVLLVWALLTLPRHRVEFMATLKEFRLIVIAFCAFFLWATASLLLSGSGPRDIGLTLRLPLLLLAVPVLATLRFDRRFVWWGIWVGAMSAFWIGAWDRYVNGAIRAGETYHFIIHFSDFTVLFALLLPVGWSYWREVRFGPLLVAFAIAAAMLATVWSGTRGAWLAIPVLLAFVALSGAVPMPRRPVRLAILVLALVGGLFAGWTAVGERPQDGSSASRSQRAVEEIRDYFENGNATTSVGARLELWRAGWLHFSEHPVFGVGAYRLEQANRSLAERGEPISPAVLEFGHAHNQWVELLATGGVVGVAALGALFVLPWIQFARLKRRSPGIDGRAFATAGQATLLAFAVFCLSQSMFNHQGPLGSFGFLVIFFAVLARAEADRARVASPVTVDDAPTAVGLADGQGT